MRRQMGESLLSVLKRSRELGFLGPGPVEAHIDHASAFVEAIADASGPVVDLGSGGGVPGLVLAVARPDLSLVLLDAMAKRCRFLEWAVGELDLQGQVEVVKGRAEEIGRGAWRGAAGAVVARSFGAPAVTAECAAPLLRVGGLLAVSEPPEPEDRWPADGLAPLGLQPLARAQGDAVRVLRQVEPCPARYPRRVGIPSKRPLF